MDGQLATVREAVAQLQGLELLVLHGARSRGCQHAQLDWDCAYQGGATLDPSALHVTLSDALGTDTVDLTDLDRASALLRFEAARSGRCVHERTAGAFEDFVLAVTLFWCDAGAVIRRAHDEVLAELPGS